MARVFIATLVVLASAILAAPAVGSAQQTGVAAEIRQGNCEELGAVVAPLVEATVPAGESRGNAGATPAASSFTTVPVSLGELVAGDHAIVVPFPADNELVACGEIGGALTEAGALVVGLRAQGYLEIFGIAYLSQNSDPALTNVSLFVSGEDPGLFLSATFSEPTVAEDDAARFAAALAARDRSLHLAGPFAGQVVLREGLRASASAGITAADFSATVKVTNPTEQTETPWHVGFAFHGTPDIARVITVDSGGTWSYQDPSTGTVGAGPLDTFDATPGATNTLDLVVEDATALLGVNGELAIKIDLPPPTASDVVLVAGDSLEGRTITFTGFEVWGGPGTAAQVSTPTVASAEDDAAFFAAALALRNGEPPVAGPFRGVIPQSIAGLAARPAGFVTQDFAATVTFVNPTPQAEAPWDGGLAFHLDSQAGTVQEVYFDSNGFWYYTDFPNGIQQSGTVPGFDAVLGGTNSLDLIVVGDAALFGMNGEFLARLELPLPVSSDVMAATNFHQRNLVEGREIAFTSFAVWEAPDLPSLRTATTAVSHHLPPPAIFGIWGGTGFREAHAVTGWENSFRDLSV